jgi:alpha-L-fucosidase
MKYVVFTTKHHDGFSMFDSKYTDYKVTAPDSPFSKNPRANITKEIFNAFRNEGMLVGAYFSKPDWHNENYWWPNFATPDRNVNYDPLAYPDRWKAFTDFTHNQVLELLSDYGKVDILWLDGGWVRKRPKEEMQQDYARLVRESPSGFIKSRVVDQDIRMDELVAKARQKQPGLIVVDRAVYGKNQNYLTPENRVPDNALPYPWESCIISGGGWSFTPNAKYMSGRDGVHLLVNIVAKGGNLLLNVAPGPDGTWQQGAYDLLTQIGGWMKVNGEAIYNSRAIAPYADGKIRMTAQKDGTVYFIYLADAAETTMPETIRVTSHRPAPGARVTLVGGGNEPLVWKADGNGFVVTVPAAVRAAAPSPYAWTIKVSAIERPAAR